MNAVKAGIIHFNLDEVIAAGAVPESCNDEITWIVIDGTRYLVTDYDPDKDEYRAVAEGMIG